MNLGEDEEYKNNFFVCVCICICICICIFCVCICTRKSYIMIK